MKKEILYMAPIIKACIIMLLFLNGLLELLPYSIQLICIILNNMNESYTTFIILFT